MILKNVAFSFAEPAEASSVKRLLAECSLPAEDIDQHLNHFITAS